MTQYVTGSETVRHESLLDQIKVRSAFQTPLLSRLPHETITHIQPEWPIDEPFTASDGVRDIANPHADSRLEGANFTFETPNYEVRMKAIAEIKSHGVEMSGSDRAAVIAGMNDPWDYRVGKTFTKHLNSIDNTLMYGTGSPELGGTTNERRTEGLIQSAAWTGLERVHGTASPATMVDVYNTQIPASMWSVFKDLEHSNITLESFYNDLIAVLLTAGADMETSNWNFQCGYRVMQRVARFLIADGGLALADRNQPSEDTMGRDYLNAFKLASGDVVTFRTNRWLNETDDTFTVNNLDSTPTTPTAGFEGTQNRTFYGDQTIIGHEPGCVKVGWYREPGFREIDTAGDFSQIACVSEFALLRDHPLSVAGMGNVLG